MLAVFTTTQRAYGGRRSFRRGEWDEASNEAVRRWLGDPDDECEDSVRRNLAALLCFVSTRHRDDGDDPIVSMYGEAASRAARGVRCPRLLAMLEGQVRPDGPVNGILSSSARRCRLAILLHDGDLDFPEWCVAQFRHLNTTPVEGATEWLTDLATVACGPWPGGVHWTERLPSVTDRFNALASQWPAATFHRNLIGSVLRSAPPPQVARLLVLLTHLPTLVHGEDLLRIPRELLTGFPALVHSVTFEDPALALLVRRQIPWPKGHREPPSAHGTRWERPLPDPTSTRGVLPARRALHPRRLQRWGGVPEVRGPPDARRDQAAPECGCPGYCVLCIQRPVPEGATEIHSCPDCGHTTRHNS